jgi:hypothetical protein
MTVFFCSYLTCRRYQFTSCFTLHYHLPFTICFRGTSSSFPLQPAHLTYPIPTLPFAHSLTPSPTHSPHSLTHSLTHSLVWCRRGARATWWWGGPALPGRSASPSSSCPTMSATISMSIYSALSSPASTRRPTEMLRYAMPCC